MLAGAAYNLSLDRPSAMKAWSYMLSYPSLRFAHSQLSGTSAMAQVLSQTLLPQDLRVNATFDYYPFVAHSLRNTALLSFLLSAMNLRAGLGRRASDWSTSVTAMNLAAALHVIVETFQFDVIKSEVTIVLLCLAVFLMNIRRGQSQQQPE
jgi:hypothetical protein